MKRFHWIVTALICLAAAGTSLAASRDSSSQEHLDELLSRTNMQITKLLKGFSNVKCTEEVQREKFRNDGRVDLRQQATYDYLVILSDQGGDLSLRESRIAVHEARSDRKNTPMLLSNGFATLFLVFHPYYADSFKFTFAGQVISEGRTLAKVDFEHIPGTRSPGALALRGREYPLELSGVALIDPSSGAFTRIEAGIGDSLRDIGVTSMQSAVEFAPAPFHGVQAALWLPTLATVEVQTPRQHWRNTHRFTDYKQFAVGSEEHVTTK